MCKPVFIIFLLCWNISYSHWQKWLNEVSNLKTIQILLIFSIIEVPLFIVNERFMSNLSHMERESHKELLFFIENYTGRNDYIKQMTKPCKHARTYMNRFTIRRVFNLISYFLGRF